MLQQIDIDDLKPGMYVSQVVEQTGLLKIKTKGMVNSDESINSLRAKGVKSVTIDPSRSQVELQLNQDDTTESAEQSQVTTKAPILSDAEQLVSATKVYNEALRLQSQFFKRLAANDTPSLANVKSLSLNIIDSVLAMPNGLSCLSLMNKTGKYLLEHSLNSSILLTMFAQHRNMTRAEIESLSMAGLLMDVGMINMPKDITQSATKLTAAQQEIVTTHVDIGLDLVDRCGEISDVIRDVIFNHHERLDGSGYPDAQRQIDVSVYARMAAIVDSYDAMTSERLFKKAITPARALSRLMKDASYDQTLVAQFIQCIGVHPVGSLVKLDNDRLAIVIRGNSKTPLQPYVATFYHIKTANYSEVKKIDLSRSEIQIENSVRPEEFGLNLTKFFKEVFCGSL